jgi:hypothetical protein
VSKKFEELVTEALAVEREIRAMSGDKPSIRGWVDACLKRGGLVYEDVEDVKARLFLPLMGGAAHLGMEEAKLVPGSADCAASQSGSERSIPKQGEPRPDGVDREHPQLPWRKRSTACHPAAGTFGRSV